MKRHGLLHSCARGLVLGLLLAACLVTSGCATINVDARGYRQYWEPFITQRSGGDCAQPSQLPGGASDDPAGAERL